MIIIGLLFAVNLPAEPGLYLQEKRLVEKHKNKDFIKDCCPCCGCGPRGFPKATQRTLLYRFDLEQQAWKTAPLVHNNTLWRGNAAGWIFKTAENEELWIHGGHLGNDTQPRQIVLRLHTGLTSLVRLTVRGINVTRRK